MTALTIRDVSDAAVRTMKLRAARNGQSLQAYLRGLIEREATKPTVADAVQRARRTATADVSTADILSAIDEGRMRR
jgi:antitoxin FitA